MSVNLLLIRPGAHIDQSRVVRTAVLPERAGVPIGGSRMCPVPMVSRCGPGRRFGIAQALREHRPRSARC
jgi:hypothetical protein